MWELDSFVGHRLYDGELDARGVIYRTIFLSPFLRLSFYFGFVLYLLPARAGRMFGFGMDLIPFLFGGIVSLVTKRRMKSHDGNDGLTI